MPRSFSNGLPTSYAEASYFDGYAFQHIAHFEEQARLARLRRAATDAVRNLERRGIRR